MKILVTGANGLVGRAVCRRLLAEGWPVIGGIRHDVSLPEGVEPRHIPPIGPETPWSEALRGIDAVVHLAARVHVMDEDVADPADEFRRANTLGTLRLARDASRFDVRRFVFMSSIKVNGEASGERPFTVDDPPAPADPYGQSKWEAEQGLHRLAAASPMKTTILRPPLVYGPGVGGNFLTLLRVVERGWPLPLAAVDNRRSLISATNLADAVATALAQPAGACETFLVSDGEDISVPDLIRRIARLMGRPARLFGLPPALLRLAGRLTGRQAAVDRLIQALTVDDSAFHARFGWTPPYRLDAGLAETVDWFAAERSAATSS